VSRHAGPVKGGKTVIAFVDDPTGYKASCWELVCAACTSTLSGAQRLTTKRPTLRPLFDLHRLSTPASGILRYVLTQEQ